jgi:nucleotide-binding universal stress UspA family protein
VSVPIQTPLKAARRRFTERPSLEQSLTSLAIKTDDEQPLNGIRPVTQTVVEPVIDVAHDVFGSLMAEANGRGADLLLMGWQGGFNVSHIYNSPVQRVIEHAQTDVAILKDRGLDKVDSILVPWGGGPHAQLGLEFAVRIGEATNATINLLRVVKPNSNLDSEQEAFRQSAQNVMGDYRHVQYHVQPGENLTDALTTFLNKEKHDLVIIGASHEWRIRNFLLGSIPDIIADYADCSVLMVRRHLLEH